MNIPASEWPDTVDELYDAVDNFYAAARLVDTSIAEFLAILVYASPDRDEILRHISDRLLRHSGERLLLASGEL